MMLKPLIIQPYKDGCYAVIVTKWDAETGLVYRRGPKAHSASEAIKQYRKSGAAIPRKLWDE